MGKLVLIGLVLIVVILSTILLSVRQRSEVSVEDLALRTTGQEAVLLANYAMQYGIRLLNDKSQSPTKSDLDTSTSFKKTFTSPFNVNNGTIDSLIYDYDAANNIVLDAFVTYAENNNTVNSVTRAILLEPQPDTVSIGNIDNAIYCKGPVEIQGKSTGSKGIHGDVLSEDEIIYQNKNASINGSEVIDAFPSFTDIFGVTLDELKELADYVGTNPNPVEGITFVEGYFGYNTSNGSTGSGILVVDGDLKITGTIDFTGIIWATGEIIGLGNGYIYGALFAAGLDLSETGGSFLLEFNPNLSGGKFTNLEGKGKHTILAIYEDFRN